MFDWKIRPVKSAEERYVDNIKDLDNIFLGMLKKNKELEEKITEKDSRILELNEKIDRLSFAKLEHSDFLTSITPTQVYHNKKRGNTTVKFLDGKSVTVHRMKRDKDCIETAIVYAIYKRIYPKKLLKMLSEHVIETGGEQCEKI